MPGTTKALIKVGIKKTDYAGLVNLANFVVTSMTGNANFVTPNPALADITTASTDLDTAIAAWGPVGNRGSHAQLLDLRAKAQILYNLLVSEANYVQNIVFAAHANYADQAAIIITSGFSVKNSPMPQGLLGYVTDLHRQVRTNVASNHVKLRWAKPTGLTSPANVKAYNIVRNTVANDFATGTVIGTTVKTSFLDESPAPAPATNYYWIVPINSAGNGNEGTSLAVSGL